MSSSNQQRKVSTRVYRRRRTVALLAVVVVVGLLVWGIVGLVGAMTAKPSEQSSVAESGIAVAPSADASKESGKPSSSATAEPGQATESAEAAESQESGKAKDTAEPSTPVECSDKTVKVTAKTDDSEYSAAQFPKISLIVENTSKQKCSMDLGTSAQEFTVTDDGEQIWSSQACMNNPKKNEQELKPGQSVHSTVEWQRIDTRQGCGEQAKPVGAGKYEVQVSVDGIAGKEKAGFTLK